MIKNSIEIDVIYKTASPMMRVDLKLFRSRIKSCLKGTGCADEFRVHDALYMPLEEYKKKYCPRRTYIEIQGLRVDLGELFDKIPSSIVNYSTFRQRVKRLKKDELLDHFSLKQSSELNKSEWISFFGGGKRKEFQYEGIEFLHLHGQKFRSITSFLHTISRIDDKEIIWSRIKRGWEMDEALTEPTLSLDDRPGIVYKISSDQCSEVYVGLTRTSINQRWRTHLRTVSETKTDTPLARAIRRIGPENFKITVIENDIKQTQLAERERYYITQLNTLYPNGFNVRPGGEMGGGRGKKVEYEGESFNSIEVASDVLYDRTGIAKNVIYRCLSTGKPIPQQARQMSNHPEAGKNLWRRWKSLINGIEAGRRKGEICARWSNYDNFSEDVLDGYDTNLSLIRIDESKPWCGDNVSWVSKQSAIERVHGTELVVEGKVYPSLNAVAREYEIKRTTLKNRLEVQGMEIDEAVRKELGPTSKFIRKDPIIVDGNEFLSINEAAKFVEKHYGLTFDQSRDRIRRGVPLPGKCKK